MPGSPAAEILRVMHLIEVNVRDIGITAETVDDSLCLFRPVYDRPSATTYGMSSAANTFRRGACFRRVYCIEQSDSTQQLVKFSVKLTDEIGQLLGQWDLDLKHGLHTHPVTDGKKGKAHVPFNGGIHDAALEIAARIKEGI